jgi:hypothetical protein
VFPFLGQVYKNIAFPAIPGVPTVDLQKMQPIDFNKMRQQVSRKYHPIIDQLEQFHTKWQEVVKNFKISTRIIEAYNKKFSELVTQNTLCKSLQSFKAVILIIIFLHRVKNSSRPKE